MRLPPRLASAGASDAKPGVSARADDAQRVACALTQSGRRRRARSRCRRSSDRRTCSAAARCLRGLRRRVRQMDEAGRNARARAQRVQGRVHDGVADVHAGAQRHRGGNADARNCAQHRRDRQAGEIRVGTVARRPGWRSRRRRTRGWRASSARFIATLLDRERGPSARLTEAEDGRRFGVCDRLRHQLRRAPAIDRQLECMNGRAGDFLAVEPRGDLPRRVGAFAAERLRSRSAGLRAPSARAFGLTAGGMLAARMLHRQFVAIAPFAPRAQVIAHARIAGEAQRDVGVGGAVAALAVRNDLALRIESERRRTPARNWAAGLKRPSGPTLCVQSR